MRRFIIHVLILLLMVMGILTILIGGSVAILASASFKLPSDKNILVLGTSQTECAIDDSIFSHSINLSLSSTNAMHSYLTLRKFLNEDANKIDTVLFDYNPGRMSDDGFFTEDNILARIPFFIVLMDQEDIFNFVGYKTFYKALLQIPVKNIRPILRFFQKGAVSYKDLEIGGYLKLYRDKLQEDITLREGADRNSGKNSKQEVSSYQLQLRYILKSADLCKEKGVKFILISVPCYQPEKYGSRDRLLSFYNTNLHEITWIDNSDFTLPDDAYGDIEHINYKGAEMFSQYLEDNKALFKIGSQSTDNFK
ncbi:hypothetical protein AGMMS50267_16980 [Spirochaetia bacterium]|nr:hypothetical protein AGMMS50267_16980 [Spirochaetia bacterium]